MCRYDVSAFHKKEVDWETALRRCQKIDPKGKLAEPKTALQTHFLTSSLPVRSGSGVSKSVWLGLRIRRSAGGRYRWDGSGVLLDDREARWSNGEPATALGDCVEMSEDGSWHTQACDADDSVFACEIPA